MKRVRGGILIGIIILNMYFFISTFVYDTSSYFTSKVVSKNEYSSDDIKIHLTKSNAVNKEENDYHEFNIENMSKSDSVLRISINPMWSDNEGNILLDDISFIKYTLDEEVGNYENNNKSWIDGYDGYYYYNQRFIGGDSISINIKLYIDEKFEEIKMLYENKSLIFDINAEALQCTSNAYKESWSNINPHIEEILNDICKY